MSTPSYSLVIDDGPLRGHRYPVTPTGLVLGRSSKCDIAISDLLLSRSHCRFELRGDELWVIDLASANETLVNNAPVDERRLLPGDLVKVGQTVLRMEFAAPAEAPAHAATPSAETPDVAIDLGFGKDEDSTAHAKRQFLRPVIWTLAAVLILTIGTTLILDPANRATPVTPVNQPSSAHDRTLLLQYEKIEASTDNIFRYEMSLTPGGNLAVKIDDLSGSNRYVRKEKIVDPEMLADLVRDIENSGFFALEKSYTGFAAQPNVLNEWTLTVVIGTRAHTCRVTNRQEPEKFRALRELLETFSKNELGIWAIQFSAEKLTALASDALVVARKKFDEREVKFENIFEALRNFQEAVFYLDTVNPKPAFYAEIIDGFETAESELAKRHEEQSFRADRAINLKDWPAAARELKILRELIPDRADSRNKEATRKLLDVESRLKKNRH